MVGLAAMLSLNVITLPRTLSQLTNVSNEARRGHAASGQLQKTLLDRAAERSSIAVVGAVSSRPVGSDFFSFLFLLLLFVVGVPTSEHRTLLYVQNTSAGARAMHGFGAEVFIEEVQ